MGAKGRGSEKLEGSEVGIEDDEAHADAILRRRDTRVRARKALSRQRESGGVKQVEREIDDEQFSISGRPWPS